MYSQNVARRHSALLLKFVGRMFGGDGGESVCAGLFGCGIFGGESVCAGLFGWGIFWGFSLYFLSFSAIMEIPE